jgi:hypothetical protein
MVDLYTIAVVTPFGLVSVPPAVYERIERSKRAKHGKPSIVSQRRAAATLTRLCARAAEYEWRHGREFTEVPHAHG